MTSIGARAVLDRMEADEAFALRVDDAGGSEESIAILRSEGFDVSPQDLRDAVLDRYGDQLTAEQLDAVAAGADWTPAEIAAFSGFVALGAASAASLAAIV